jgi:hypothetical protein
MPDEMRNYLFFKYFMALPNARSEAVAIAFLTP